MEDKNKMNESQDPLEVNAEKPIVKTINLSGMYEDWFLDYASYVILDRAVPALDDGLKPVQRRILHSMRELDDGRYNKVANIIGNTMKYHPHGDASIGDALVQLGQKDLLIDCQGNWGNSLTGDSAAAPRYIEARLSKFALDVAFNPKTTNWKLSYDGRNNEPLALPTKFPLLLAQGVEGIAVGLATKTLPHNFIEIIDAAINHLKGQDFDLVPDFPTGGMVDVSRYNDGQRGSRVRVRAKIRQVDKKTLEIYELPYSYTTSKVIDSIVLANDKGKIKIKKIDDNTSSGVAIIIHLAGGVSPDQTIDALYAFTDCEISLSPNACIIHNKKPHFMGIKEVLRYTTDHTVDLLKLELQIKKHELLERLQLVSLEKIFIEERIYKDAGYENANDREEAIRHIDTRLIPFKSLFFRAITDEDIIRLFEIKMGRILKFNSEKAEDLLHALQEELKVVENHLAHLIEYAIDWYLYLKKTYSKGRERRTELRSFDTIEATRVAVANVKLYMNSEEGFAGTNLKKDEFICDCSDIDDILVIRADGSLKITKVHGKFFVGPDVIHIAVFQRNDERTIYNMVYRDGPSGVNYVKRFAVKGVTRDKDYDATKGTKGSKVLYFTANPNGEAEVVAVKLRPRAKLRRLKFDFDFSSIAIKGRGAGGNILAKTPIKEIKKVEDGASTLGAIDLWFDDTVKRLNTDERGTYLGDFSGDDKVLTLMKSGKMRFYSFDIATHFSDDMFLIEKFDPQKILTVIYWNSELKCYYLKRLLPEVSDRELDLFSLENGNKLQSISYENRPQLLLKFDKRKNREHFDDETIDVEAFSSVKGIKAKGRRVSAHHIKKIDFLVPLPHESETSSIKESEPTHTEVLEDESDVESVNEALEQKMEAVEVVVGTPVEQAAKVRIPPVEQEVEVEILPVEQVVKVETRPVELEVKVKTPSVEQEVEVETPPVKKRPRILRKKKTDDAVKPEEPQVENPVKEESPKKKSSTLKKKKPKKSEASDVSEEVSQNPNDIPMDIVNPEVKDSEDDDDEGQMSLF